MGRGQEMPVRFRHAWNVTPERARKIQLELREEWEGEDRLGRIRIVAGADVAFVMTGSQALRSAGPRRAMREANRAIAGVVVYRFPQMEEIERAYAVRPLEFPYVPGLLSFREIPALLEALAKIRHTPDLIFCDAHGYAHPRRFGLACHLGVLLGRPSIGCAKSLLIGTHAEPAKARGSWAPITDRDARGEPEVIGAVLRTRDAVRPVYVSQGHRISLERAIELTLAVSDGFRIPRPTREADHFVRRIKREIVARSLASLPRWN
jgi:deoxyribonuclease V